MLTKDMLQLYMRRPGKGFSTYTVFFFFFLRLHVNTRGAACIQRWISCSSTKHGKGVVFKERHVPRGRCLECQKQQKLRKRV